ncbi:hypothetical protein C8046_13615 [Serinibacter arcticus]|uniref:Uncharacterized protein n=1 Tax=Serinibacter arcticus TaxID=1655435 RepID=A0A2U1ZX25_9MICO|nr:hypothetical protein [Serinibacter arcticus]PWD51539.1 hypothetical protein C8046_13615 [Serinibacter arcticus]
MSSTPFQPVTPVIVPAAAGREPEDETRDGEVPQSEVEEEVEVVSKINDPANDDVFEHLRPSKD